MKKASAIVTIGGGRTCHASNYCFVEMGFPAVGGLWVMLPIVFCRPRDAISGELLLKRGHGFIYNQ